MKTLITKNKNEVKCAHCGYVWTYKGRKLLFKKLDTWINCPTCFRMMRISVVDGVLQ